MLNIAFYETNFFGAIVGFVASFLILKIQNIQADKKDQEIRNKELFMLIIQSNQDLFSSIYYGSEEEPDYVEMKEQILTFNISLIFHKELRQHFFELRKILCGTGEYFRENKNRVQPILKEIVKIIESCGDVLFEFK